MLGRSSFLWRRASASAARSVHSVTSRKLPREAQVETEEWGVFPREREGNQYLVNWSLTDEGITSTGNAFHNARLPLLTTRLSGKVASGKVEVTAPEYYGEVSTLEAGESITFDDFEAAFSAQKEHFSRGADLLVEDRGLGSFAPFRLGTRVVTDDAATALIFRQLLIPTPPRDVDHRARFDGWNFDARWNEPEVVWDGTKYDMHPSQVTPKPGQRPLMAVIGGAGLNGKSAGVQFVEVNSSLVGANVCAGSAVSVMGIVDAVGSAYCGTFNEKFSDAVALSSLSLVKNGETALVVGAPDEFTQSTIAKKTIYGAYHNVISTAGTSAVWNGAIVPSTDGSGSNSPAVVVKGSSVRVLNPNNLAFAPSSLFFYEAGAKKSKLSTADAVKRLIEATGEEGKEAVFAEVLKNVKDIHVVSAPKHIE